jgi:hypothetical protein
MLKTKTKPKTKQPARRLERGFVTDHLSVYDGAAQAGTIVRFDADYCAFDMRGELVGGFPDLRDAVRALPKAEAA